MTTASVIRQIESLFVGGSVAGMTDRELIERFNAARDATGEAAFAAIVSRHGPMVLDICAQILGDQYDAEDAFQAVFLVLARKARSLGDPDLLANWLFGVALRTAGNARAQKARRRKNEEAAIMRLSASGSSVLIDLSVSTPEAAASAREQAEMLYCEIDRLPRPFRLAVVLYYFEGLTLDDTARRLRCPAGTVRSRLARACDKLRRGLMRRGVALSTAAVASALSSQVASAGVSPALCQTASRAGLVALAPGYGAGWLALDVDAHEPVADITLPPEQIIHGRVFDLLGQPAGNVRVSVTAILRVVLPQPQLIPRRSGYDGPRFWWAHPDDLPGGPRTASLALPETRKAV